MKKKTKQELASEWAKKNSISGQFYPWSNNKICYNLTVSEILSMAKYIEKKYEEQLL